MTSPEAGSTSEVLLVPCAGNAELGTQMGHIYQVLSPVGGGTPIGWMDLSDIPGKYPVSRIVPGDSTTQCDSCAQPSDLVVQAIDA